jgi:hypothetical protein
MKLSADKFLPLLLPLATLCVMESIPAACSDDQYPVIVGGRNTTCLQRVLDEILTLPFIARIITNITENINIIYTSVINILITPFILAIEEGQDWNS